MIAKISHGISLYGAVIYNQEKVNEGTARIISANRVLTDMSGEQKNVLSKILLSFEPYLTANNRTKKPVLHISLNPALEDRLTDEQFTALAKDYMEKMNYGDQPYLVYMHEDIDRRHIHIVSLCVDETGRKINDSYEHRRSMTACRELEIQYGLKNIADERQESDTLFLKKVEYEKGNVKHQISNTLKNVSDYKFRTFGEYSALLFCFNVEVKTVKGEGIDGKPFNGIVYSATDNTGKIVSNPFKSSLLGKVFGYEALNKKMQRNEKSFKEGKYAPMIRSAIATAMKTTRDKEKFTAMLKNSGIDVVFRENAQGRLYGVTFIDHSRKEVYNGSALGKEFSANVFHKLFNEKTADNNSLSQKSHLSQSSQLSHNNSETALEQIFGIFDLPLPEERDYEEEAFQRQMKRRRKKKQRHL